MLSYYLQQPFAQHALIAGTLVAVVNGLIGPFVVSRQMSFAVHGIAELSFTGAAAGLLVADDAVSGALLGSLVVAAVLGAMTVRERERDSSIGVVLAFGLGVGIFLLSHYRGFATNATNLLFGQLLGVSERQLWTLATVAVVVLLAMAVMWRPLLFASTDPEVARTRGVPVRALGIAFLVVLALSVTEAAQVVGTTLVLSLAITPAAAAQRLSSRPAVVTLLSIGVAVMACDGGLLLSFAHPDVKPTVFVTTLSFAAYVFARLRRRT